jgi:hypothetical protein
LREEGVLTEPDRCCFFCFYQGAQFTMMGTAEEVKAPEQKPVFVEDLPAEQAEALQLVC